MKLVLASQSPRRAELLKQMALPFSVRVCDIDESRRPDEAPAVYVERLAQEKSAVGFGLSVEQGMTADDLVTLGADTIVVVDEEILGKPRGPKEGMDMLAQLSGKTHQVLTGVAVHRQDRRQSTVVSSQVTFRDLSPADIERYWYTGEGADKAGSYGIQGIGGILVAHIEGSFSAVMGLPVAETETLLQAVDVETWKLRDQWLKNSS